jgi:hypothetical protein
VRKKSSTGYITGIGVERTTDPYNIGRRLFATFEYNGETIVYQVPDPELFEILAQHLCGMASSRKNSDDYGYSKLWIEKKDGKWIVDLP